MTTDEFAALRYLRDHPNGEAASSIGAAIYRDKKRKRVISQNGGGDYAAQMLLGRMRKKGWVRTNNRIGSSTWVLEPAGRQALDARSASGDHYTEGYL